MQTVHTVAELRATLAKWRQAGHNVAFVPTMGDLHEGHLSLVREAKQRAAKVVCSIFVNPLQFGENEDFDSYPRILDSDSEKLQAEAVDLLFAPTVVEVYPNGQDNVTKVVVPQVGDGLCGASRPGHFDGVSTVVSKLFNMVQPDLALFGEKDFQQLLVIRKMAADLCFAIEIIAVSTHRELDGLAMSSRNGYLNEQQRDQAPALQRELRKAKQLVESGSISDFNEFSELARVSLSQSGFIVDYFELRSAADLTKVAADERDLVILAAAWLGKARLIDNIRVRKGEK